MSQYGAVEDGEENRCGPGSHFQNKHDKPHCDRRQVNDWNMLKGEMDHSEAKQGQEDRRKRTGADYKHDHRNNQDNPTLVRTQDPSPPDDDAVGDNELN